MYPSVHSRLIYNTQTREQKYPSTNEWRISDIYINGVLLSHKKECNYVICNNVNGPRGYYFLSEISQIKKNTVCYHLYVESKKNKTNKCT